MIERATVTEAPVTVKLRARRLLFACLLAAGCHTSPARQQAIEEGVGAVNRQRRAAAVARVIAARGATPLDGRITWLRWEEDIQWCRPELRGLPTAPPAHDVTLTPVGGGASIAVDCESLREATVRHRAFEGKTTGGRPVVIIPDRVEPERVGDDVEPAFLATQAGGKLLVLEPHKHVVVAREIRLARVCGRMPSLPQPPQLAGVTAAYHVVEGRRLSEVERVPVPFDGEAVSTRCDDYLD